MNRFIDNFPQYQSRISTSRRKQNSRKELATSHQPQQSKDQTAAKSKIQIVPREQKKRKIIELSDDDEEPKQPMKRTKADITSHLKQTKAKQTNTKLAASKLPRTADNRKASNRTIEVLQNALESAKHWEASKVALRELGLHIPNEGEGWPGLGREENGTVPDVSDGEEDSEAKVKSEDVPEFDSEVKTVVVKEEDKGAQLGLRRGKMLRRIAPHR